MYPPELLYTKDHEWIRWTSPRTIGITDYAHSNWVTSWFVELPKPGDHVTAKEVFGTVESVKAVSKSILPSPVRLSQSIQSSRTPRKISTS